MRSGDIRVNGKSLAELVGGERGDGVRRAATVASKKSNKAAKTKNSSLAFSSKNIDIPADNDDSTSSTTSVDADEYGTINDPGSYVIQNGDHITHVTEIEENIVLNPKNQCSIRYTAPHHGEAETGVEILHESEDLLVVNKPASFPVHPTGGYKYLTLTGLLEAGRFWRNKNATATAASGTTSSCGSTQASASPSSSCTGACSTSSTAFPSSYRSLHTAHRLDRFTSGVVLLAKTKEKARELQAAFRERDAETKEASGLQQEREQQNQKQKRSTSDNKPKMRLQKTYLCLVRGHLRERIKEHCAGGGGGSESVWDAEDVSAYWPEDINSDKNPWVRVHGGMRCANHRQAVHEFVRMGMPADYDLTLVLAKPKTGRTHQIRVHLQHLGHPIANDPCYNAKYHAKRGGKKVQASDDIYSGSTTAPTASSCSAGAGAPLGTADFPDYPLFPGGHYSGIFLHAWEYKFDVVPGVETKTTKPNAAETDEVEIIKPKAANKEQKQNGAWAYETPLPWWVGPQFFPQGNVNMRRHESEYSPREFQNYLAIVLTRFRDSL
eukprot:g11322.t1